MKSTTLLLALCLSVSPAFSQETAIPVERDLYWLWGNPPNRRALRRGDWKIVRYARGEPNGASDWQLFNLAKDPREQSNLAAKHPEKLEALHQAYLAQRAKDKIP